MRYEKLQVDLPAGATITVRPGEVMEFQDREVQFHEFTRVTFPKGAAFTLKLPIKE